MDGTPDNGPPADLLEATAAPVHRPHLQEERTRPAQHPGDMKRLFLKETRKRKTRTTMIMSSSNGTGASPAKPQSMETRAGGRLGILKDSSRNTSMKGRSTMMRRCHRLLGRNNHGGNLCGKGKGRWRRRNFYRGTHSMRLTTKDLMPRRRLLHTVKDNKRITHGRNRSHSVALGHSHRQGALSLGSPNQTQSKHRGNSGRSNPSHSVTVSNKKGKKLLYVLHQAASGFLWLPAPVTLTSWGLRKPWIAPDRWWMRTAGKKLPQASNILSIN